MNLPTQRADGNHPIFRGRAVAKLCIAFVFVNVNLLIGQSIRPLTTAQVEQLIGVMPDKALAREIRQRGAEFKVDRAGLARLKDLDAGSETIASLAELLANAQLVVISMPPNCDVSLN